MKKIYAIYIATGLFTSWIVLFLLGFSAGFAGYAPIAALFGSISLFAFAAPILVYAYRVGLILGLIGCLLVLPYNILFLKGIIDDGVLNWVVLLGIVPPILVLLGLYFSIKMLWIGEFEVEAFSKVSRLLLCGIPIILFVIYLLLYGQYWSWEILRVH